MRRSPPQPARVIYALYVPLVDPSGTKQQAVAHIAALAPQLWPRGIDIEVYQIRPRDLRNRRVLTALRQKGVDSLPALLAHGQAYVGLRAIGGFQPPEGYATARADGGGRATARGQPDITEAGPGTQGEEAADEEAAADLEEYFKDEMRVGRRSGEIDTDDLGD